MPIGISQNATMKNTTTGTDSSARLKNMSIFENKPLPIIKHNLPVSMHDIMPHEHPRFQKVNHEKVHNDFLLREGPKLQRKLYHHFTIEELRQKRKELKERWIARHNKLLHVTPYAPHDKKDDVLKLPSSTTAMMEGFNKEHHTVGKKLEVSTVSFDTTRATTVKEKSTPFLMKSTSEEPKFDHQLLGSVHDQGANSSPSTLNSSHGLEIKTYPTIHNEPLKVQEIHKNDLEEMATIRPSLLSSIRNKHRLFSAKIHSPTTSIPDTSTTQDKNTLTKNLLSNASSNLLDRTHKLQEKKLNEDLLSLSFPIPQGPFETTVVPETTTILSSEPYKYKEEWKKHLKAAFKRRLHKMQSRQD